MNITRNWFRSAMVALALTAAASAAQAASWTQTFRPSGGYDYFTEGESATYTHNLNSSTSPYQTTGGSWSAFKAAYTLTSATLKLYFADDGGDSYEYVSYRLENGMGGWAGWQSGGEVGGTPCYFGDIFSGGCRAGYDVVPDLGVSVALGLLGDDLLSYQIRADYNGVAFDSGDFYFKGSILEVNGTPTEVPEPATLALLGLGLAGAALVRRRRSA